MCPDPMPEQRHSLVVAQRRDEARGVVSLVLTDPASTSSEPVPLPSWAPGAHIDLELAPGLIRQYSLCGDPADRSRWRVAVLREQDGRGGSTHVHERLHEGCQVEVRGPRNHFALQPAPAYLFVAGGIGITPILPMLRQARADGLSRRLAYGGRSVASMAFLDEVAPDGDHVDVVPQDSRGPLPVPALVGWARQADADIYVCGPEPLLAAVEDEGRRVLGEGRVHAERFRPRADPAAAGPGQDTGFELVVSSHGVSVPVPPGRSALEALEQAGIPILSSCREGTCGTCEVAVLSGSVEHRDSLLSPTERAAMDTMFVCVSRALGPRLVIEL